MIRMPSDSPVTGVNPSDGLCSDARDSNKPQYCCKMLQERRWPSKKVTDQHEGNGPERRRQTKPRCVIVSDDAQKTN